MSDFPIPTDNLLLQYTLKGIRRAQGDSTRPRLPITTTILKLLKSRLHASSIPYHDKRMLWAAFCTAFYGFLRSSEFTSPSPSAFDINQTLLRSDIDLQERRCLLKLKASKTDPFRRGTTVTLTSITSSTCPVTALRNYVTAAMCTASHPPETPLFHFQDGRFLTRHNLVESIRALLATSGIPSHHYASHSFRIGAATSAAAAGIPDWLIQTLGRWTSQCYQLYIRTPGSVIQDSFQQMASASVRDI